MAGFSRLTHFTPATRRPLGLADYMDYLTDDDATHADRLFIETIRDPSLRRRVFPRRGKERSFRCRAESAQSLLLPRGDRHTETHRGKQPDTRPFSADANVMRVNTLDDLCSKPASCSSGLRDLPPVRPRWNGRFPAAK